MNGDHDRFEMLAGAVMLGEATAGERERFEAHADACARCRDDVRTASVVERLARARDGETWRPSLRNGVIARVRASRTSRFRVTVGAFGWALALSLGVNLAIATGLSSRLGTAFSPAGEPVSYVTATKIRLETPSPFRVPAFVFMRVAAARPVRRASRSPRALRSLVAKRAPTVASEVPDVLAGLDIDPGDAAAGRRVALGFDPDPTADAVPPASPDL